MLLIERSNIKCQSCKDNIDRRADSHGLTIGLDLLNIQNGVVSVQKSVDHYFETDSIQFTCDKCGARSESCPKQTSLDEAPEILSITFKFHSADNIVPKGGTVGPLRKPHLKFQDHTTINIKAKIHTRQDEMEQDETEPSLNHDIGYQLYGVIIHHGWYQTGGHYTFVGRGSGCASREACNGTYPTCSKAWRHWDDAVVSNPSTMDTILRTAFKVQSAPRDTMVGSRGSSPFILLYARVQKEGSNFESTAPNCALCDKGTSWRRSFMT